MVAWHGSARGRFRETGTTSAAASALQCDRVGAFEHGQALARADLRGGAGGLGDVAESADGQVDGAHEIDLAFIDRRSRPLGKGNHNTHWDIRSFTEGDA